jgi:aminoglycoside phosphotransferase (APT) family kinase protein
VAARFATDDLFYALRLEPYLEATARKHTDLAPQFAHLVETTRMTKRVLVHGDFSPKNLLIGPAGPSSSTRNARGTATPLSTSRSC